MCERERGCVCVCVRECVCEREREREKDLVRLALDKAGEQHVDVRRGILRHLGRLVRCSGICVRCVQHSR